MKPSWKSNKRQEVTNLFTLSCMVSLISNKRNLQETYYIYCMLLKIHVRILLVRDLRHITVFWKQVVGRSHGTAPDFGWLVGEFWPRNSLKKQPRSQERWCTPRFACIMNHVLSFKNLLDIMANAGKMAWFSGYGFPIQARDFVAKENHFTQLEVPSFLED